MKKSRGKNFVGLDAGFNDMMRTILYGAQHPFITCGGGEMITADLVGPICETGDVFRTDVPLKVREGGLVALLDVGAYGYSMASNYLTRPRPPEIGIYQRSRICHEEEGDA